MLSGMATELAAAALMLVPPPPPPQAARPAVIVPAARRKPRSATYSCACPTPLCSHGAASVRRADIAGRAGNRLTRAARGAQRPVARTDRRAAAAWRYERLRSSAVTIVLGTACRHCPAPSPPPGRRRSRWPARSRCRGSWRPCARAASRSRALCADQQVHGLRGPRAWPPLMSTARAPSARSACAWLQHLRLGRWRRASPSSSAASGMLGVSKRHLRQQARASAARPASSSSAPPEVEASTGSSTTGTLGVRRSACRHRVHGGARGQHADLDRVDAARGEGGLDLRAHQRAAGTTCDGEHARRRTARSPRSPRTARAPAKLAPACAGHGRVRRRRWSRCRR